jgi:hypothetical protein
VATERQDEVVAHDQAGARVALMLDVRPRPGLAGHDSVAAGAGDRGPLPARDAAMEKLALMTVVVVIMAIAPPRVA